LTFTLVGLADVEVKEARERVRCAIQNSGLEFPSNKRITVNLAPADLPKDSGRLDLAIALGILAASGQMDAQRLEGYEFAGELSLSGELRPVRGALAMALTTLDAAAPVRLVLPPGSADEASLVAGAHIYCARHLLDVVRQFLPAGVELADPQHAENGWCRMEPSAPTTRAMLPDMADVKGQAGAKRALEIAAAGGHSLLLVGPPGSGKSMLAQRFAGLLPEMSNSEALQSAAIHSLNGHFSLEQWGQRPTCAPHHSASAVALVGGGCDFSKSLRHFLNECDDLTQIFTKSSPPLLGWRFFSCAQLGRTRCWRRGVTALRATRMTATSMWAAGKRASG